MSHFSGLVVLTAVGHSLCVFSWTAASLFDMLRLSFGFKERSVGSSPELIKSISRSTRLSLKFFLFINVKMPTIVGILIFMSRKIAL